MYPPQFDYYRPASVAEALLLQKEHDGKYLAGGHSLIPVMKLRLSDPGVLIDIGRLNDLKGIDINGNMSSIRALTTYAEIEKAEGLPDMVTEAVGWIGDQMVRNRGTIGGSIAHADPASDMPTVLTALNAVISTVGSDATRRISADDFFTGLFETDLSENEIVAEIEFASKQPGTGSAYAKLFNPASRYAIVGAAAVITMNGNTCSAASVAIGGLLPSATRASSVEAALVGKEMTDANIQAAAEAVAADLGDDVMADIHASADYRRAMAVVYVKRAIETAVSRA